MGHFLKSNWKAGFQVAASVSQTQKKLHRQLSALTLHSNVVDLMYDREPDNEVSWFLCWFEQGAWMRQLCHSSVTRRLDKKGAQICQKVAQGIFDENRYF